MPLKAVMNAFQNSARPPVKPCPDGPFRIATPDEAGFDVAKLAAAIQFASECETPWPRNLSEGLNADPSANEPPPWNTVLGPTQDRDPPNGLVIRNGALVAEYGNTQAVDMSFSIAKSYLAVLTGVAVKLGYIRDIDEPMRNYALDDGFEPKQNREITWRHMLHQTSEWEGTLWSKPDLIDRNRQVGLGADNSNKGTHRDLQAPGTFYEYNDVRVNRLSLSLMQVFREELGNVLKREVMDPVGASSTWQWHPYENAKFTIDGRTLGSVPGGSHWGGGLFMHAQDHARFGWMMANDGRWYDQDILPPGWARTLTEPSPCNPGYGGLWWLNRKGEKYANAPATSYFAMGAGTNLIWVDPELDLVMVMRWIDNARANELISQVLAAMTS